MAARIRHIALCVKDIKATAEFYEKAFGLKRTEIKEGATAWNCYMSDGEINLALLQYKGETGSGVPKGWVGIHHFGFQCDDLPAQQKKVEAAGGAFFYDLGEPEDEGFDGRRLWVLTVVDTRSRICPVMRVCRSATALEVIDALEQARRQYGLPTTIRVDQGSQITSKELDLWA